MAERNRLSIAVRSRRSQRRHFWVPPSQMFHDFCLIEREYCRTVHLEDGVMQRGTYKPMPTHRLFTDEGLFVLDSFIEDKLLSSLTESGSVPSANSRSVEE